MNKIYPIIIISIATFLGACTVGPDYENPKADMPSAWSVKEDGKVLADDDNPKALTEEELAKWWDVFDDAQLTSLIERAFKGNLTIASAQAKIAQARATLGIAQSGLYPTLDGTASFKERGLTINGEGQSYGIGASTNWELDVFGGTRRGIESTVASYQQSIANKVAARIAVAAEVAQNYFEYRAVQQQLEIVKSNLQTQEKTCNITRQRLANGWVSRLDVVRAEAQVEATRAKIPQLENSLILLRHSLEFLLGEQSGKLAKELARVEDLPELERFIPLGVPASLVQRRPDIIAAEYALHAATAKIGNARADYYPKFFVSGNVSYQAPNIGDVVSNQYGSWSIGPNVSWNLFQAGKTFYNVRLQESLEEQAGVSWKSVILTALKEVEDSIVSAAKERERIVYLNKVVESTKSAFDLSSQLYVVGKIEFLDLLDAQRSMLEAEQSQVLCRQLFIKHVISLYKSLGGGWTQEDAKDEEMQDSFLDMYLDDFFARDPSEKSE